MDHPPLASRLVNASHCSHLRHKGMYVMSDADPADGFDAYDATAYWCSCTQKALGPDGGRVHPETCQPGRECCR